MNRQVPNFSRPFASPLPRVPSPGGAPSSAAPNPPPTHHKPVVEQTRGYAQLLQPATLVPQRAPVGTCGASIAPVGTGHASSLYAFPLLGARTSSLLQVLLDRSPWIDEQLGELVHLCNVGDPRGSESLGRKHLEQLGHDLGLSASDWLHAVEQRGDADSVITQQAQILARTFCVLETQLPCVVLWVAGQPTAERRVVAIPPVLDASIQAALGAVRAICNALSVENLRAQLGSAGSRDAGFTCAIVTAVADRMARELRDLAGDVGSALKQRQLTATDASILDALAKSNARLTTQAIAQSLGQSSPKSIGKNLARLVTLGLIENKRRYGYLLTQAGCDARLGA